MTMVSATLNRLPKEQIQKINAKNQASIYMLHNNSNNSQAFVTNGSGSSLSSMVHSVTTNNDSEQIKDFAEKCMLHSSTCSSGYGSHDSSPECSVHSPDWLPNNFAPLLSDSAIYHNKNFIKINASNSFNLPISNSNMQKYAKIETEKTKNKFQSEDEHIYYELEVCF